MTTLTTRAALLRFNELRHEAAKLMQEAALLSVPDHYRAQARSAANLCNTALHRVYGEGDATDARQLADDLEHFAKAVADPVVEAIGRHADGNFHGITLDLFQDRLLDDIDGNATYVLHKAADEIEESCADTNAEMRREFLRAE